MIDYIIVGLVLVAVFIAVKKVLKSSNNGGCAGCSGCSSNNRCSKH